MTKWPTHYSSNQERNKERMLVGLFFRSSSQFITIGTETKYFPTVNSNSKSTYYFYFFHYSFCMPLALNFQSQNPFLLSLFSSLDGLLEKTVGKSRRLTKKKVFYRNTRCFLAASFVQINSTLCLRFQCNNRTIFFIYIVLLLAILLQHGDCKSLCSTSASGCVSNLLSFLFSMY